MRDKDGPSATSGDGGEGFTQKPNGTTSTALSQGNGDKGTPGRRD